jgi:hypothetical protein
MEVSEPSSNEMPGFIKREVKWNIDVNFEQKKKLKKYKKRKKGKKRKQRDLAEKDAEAKVFKTTRSREINYPCHNKTFFSWFFHKSN